MNNVLTLDGGGVRGLSTLLILQKLMEFINSAIVERRPPGVAHKVVGPHDIFDLVAGTSTGGLIAVMLGKLGMTIEQCIEAYHSISKAIFGKKHIRGILTAGLAPARYSGSGMRNNIRKLIQERQFDMDLAMASPNSRDRIACALVCREHQTQSRYSKFKAEAVFICSLPCPDAFACLVCDAARATSAAPTYFPVQKINGRSFVDGGIQFNNPSHETFRHCTKSYRLAEARRASIVTEPTTEVHFHGDLDLRRTRFVNLGTGSTPPTPEALQKFGMANFIPPAIRYGIFLSKALKEVAVDSEKIAEVMRTLVYVSKGNLKYERFSADNGVCFIKLDKWKKLSLIEKLTSSYLEVPAVKENLRRVGREIAEEYVEKLQRTENSARLDMPRENRPVQLHIPASSPRPHPERQSSDTQPSTGLSNAVSDNSAARLSVAETASTAPSK